MFNNNLSQSVNIKPAATGILQKSCKCSRIRHAHIKSSWTENLFNNNEVVILQIMVFGDNQMIVEYAYIKDLDKEE